MKRPATRLRPATTSDLGAMNSIMGSSLAYAGQYRAMLDGYEITPEQIAESYFFLAERDREILGFYALAPEPEPELDLMFVSNSAQGMGVGRSLFDHLLDTAARKGFESVKIVSHPPSIGFYQRMGAVQTGMHPPSKHVTWERPILRIDVAGRAFARTDDAGRGDPL